MMLATANPRPVAAPRTLLLGALFFASGAAALIYQVLWARELGLLFGATAQAAALTVAIFFAGLAAGGWVWGGRAARSANPLRAFGWLEVAVAAAAMAHFVVADAYFALWPALHALTGGSAALETALKALVAASLLGPAAFLMGGTLPMMGQHLIRGREALGRVGPAIYAVNTLGGAAGALAAGFVLPAALGFHGAYLLAVGIDLGVGLACLALARGARAAAPAAGPAARPVALPPVAMALAAVSGAATLAVEVVWTRLFAQVLQNSAYTYALVLTTFLAALALGSGLAALIARQRLVGPGPALALLLLAGAAVVGASPWLMDRVTDGMTYLGEGRDFAGYVAAVGWTAALVMLGPGAILGAVLPALMRLIASERIAPGAALGRLVAANTAGAILGALGAGFVLLPVLGAWGALAAVAALYALAAAAAALALTRGRVRALAGPALAAAAFLALSPAPLPPIRLPAGFTLVDLREGAAASAAVVERDGFLSIRVNTHYTLGGTAGAASERNQALIPLMLHPAPRSAFFLGLGTGLTAGAATLDEGLERIVACELLPEVVALSRAHFASHVFGLFDDPRVTIHAEDGRHCLARSPERFDVIVSDLFTPWEAGTGYLYTVEHFAQAARRLEPGGLYAQWLPLYQIGRAEFDVIAASMAAVFPDLTLWRGDFFPERSIVALVGRLERTPLDAEALAARAAALTQVDLDRAAFEAMALELYVGPARWSPDAPLNTDARPVIERMAPRTHRAVLAGAARFLTGPERDRLYEDHAWPEDPRLAGLTEAQRAMVEAGRLYAAWNGARARGEPSRALWAARMDRAPPTARVPRTPAQAAIGTVTTFR